MEVYLDNNATTKIDEDVLNAMLPYLKEQYGNPSSIYNIGRNNKKIINKARISIANLLNASKDDIVFTSCGSESNVTAIFSAISNNDKKKYIITRKFEKCSIFETME